MPCSVMWRQVSGILRIRSLLCPFFYLFHTLFDSFRVSCTQEMNVCVCVCARDLQHFLLELIHHLNCNVVFKNRNDLAESCLILSFARMLCIYSKIHSHMFIYLPTFTWLWRQQTARGFIQIPTNVTNVQFLVTSWVIYF